MGTTLEKSGTSKTEVREWVISIFLVLSIVGGLLWRKGSMVSAQGLWGVAALLFALSLLAPLLLNPLYRGWLLFTRALGWVVIIGALGIIYYLICMPISFMLKLSGKDLLDEDFGRDAETFWKDKKVKEVKEVDLKEYERQY